MKPIPPLIDSVGYTIANATAGISGSLVAYISSTVQNDVTFILGSLISCVALHNLIHTAINKYKRKR